MVIVLASGLIHGGNDTMTRKAAFVYSDKLSSFLLSESHPMKPIRLRHTYDLIQDYGVFDLPDASLVEARSVTDDEVLRFHKPEYLQCVKHIGDDDSYVDPAAFGFGPGDNPVSEGLYDAAALSAGASVVAAELLVSGGFDRAFSIMGGLHHAMPGYASGFCVFNDPVLAIQELLARGLKVAYVDIDCHHGDGVQYAFYDTDAVLTISVHESGSFLFPGTGFVAETGTGKGSGYSANVPLYPYTTDETYLWAFREAVPPLIEAFAPDVVVTQLGIDSHYRDPITHLGLTVQGFASAVADLAGTAPKWLALGGGGYDMYAVARAWTAAYAVMIDISLPDAIPDTYRDRHGVSTLSDHDDLSEFIPHQKDARQYAEKSILELQQQVFPVHGLR